MKTGHKVATAEEVLVTKGENLVANATDTVAMSSPVIVLRTPHTEKLKVCILVEVQNVFWWKCKIFKIFRQNIH